MADERSTSNVPPELRRQARPAVRDVRRPARAVEGNGLWDRPQLLNLISDVLMVVGAAGLGYAAVAALSRLPAFPLREVVVMTPLAQVTTPSSNTWRARLRGNFFIVDPRRRPRAFEKLPWVRRPTCAGAGRGRRGAPRGARGVGLLAVGETGDMRLVNRYGEVFSAASNARMPVFSGPEGSSGVAAIVRRVLGKLSPLGKQLVGVSLSARRPGSLKLEDGLTIELGHDQVKAPSTSGWRASCATTPRPADWNMNVAVVDLRYPSGFALPPHRPRGPAGKQDKKGKR